MHQWLTAPEKQFGSSIQVLLFDLMRGIGIAARPDDSRGNGAGLRTSRSSLSIRTLRSHVREYDVRYGSSAPYVLPASIPDAAGIDQTEILVADTDRGLPARIAIFTYPGWGPTSRCSHAPRGTRLEPAGSPAASLVSRP